MKVFNLVAADKMGIVASRTEMFAEKIEKSCTAPVISKD